MKKEALVVLVLLVVQNVCGLATITAPSFTKEVRATSIMLNRVFALHGQVVAADPIAACSPLTNSAQLKGKIAYVRGGGCGGLNKLALLKDIGVSAILWGDELHESGSGALAYVLQGEGLRSSEYPLNGADFHTSAEIDKQIVAGNVSIAMNAPDSNTFQDIVVAYIFLCIVVGGMAVATASISLWKLIKLIRKNSLEVSAAQVTLFLVFITSLERILFVVDPLFAFGLYPYIISNILLTGSFHLTYICTLIICFYWAAAMRKTNVNGIPYLNKLKIPLIIACAIIFVMEVVSSFVRGTYSASVDFQALITITSGMYLVVGVLVSIFYFIVGGRILYRLHGNPTGHVHKRSIALKKITTLIICSGLFLVIFVIGFGLFLVIAVDGPSFCGITWIIYVGISGVSLCQSLIFVVPKSSASDSPQLSNKLDQVRVSGTSSDSAEKPASHL